MENKAYMQDEGHPPPYNPNAAAPGEPQPYPQPYPQPQVQPQGGYGYAPQPGQASNTSVVVVAPQSQTMHSGAQVQDNMIISIVSIFFCCILGIIATIKASDSKEAVRQGNIAKAEQDSALARKLAIAAIVIGIACCAISILSSIIVSVAGAAAASSSSYN